MAPRTWVFVCLFAAMTVAGAWAEEGDENLLKNAGLEAGGFDGWVYFGQGWRVSDYISEVSRDMHEGKFGLLNEIAPTDGDEWRGAEQVVRIKPNKAYEAGVWIRAVQVGDSQSYLEVRFLDKQSNIIEQVQSVAVGDDQDFTWVDIDYMESPQDAHYAAIRAVVQMMGKPERDIAYHMFDDFVFAETKRLSKSAKKKAAAAGD
jgi:hypothetical protein